jgi:hypothetical protein
MYQCLSVNFSIDCSVKELSLGADIDLICLNDDTFNQSRQLPQSDFSLSLIDTSVVQHYL